MGTSVMHCCVRYFRTILDELHISYYLCVAFSFFVRFCSDYCLLLGIISQHAELHERKCILSWLHVSYLQTDNMSWRDIATLFTIHTGWWIYCYLANAINVNLIIFVGLDKIEKLRSWFLEYHSLWMLNYTWQDTIWWIIYWF